MPSPALVVLPGAPLALADLTPSVVPLPDEIVALRVAIDAAVADVGSGPVVVVAGAASTCSWPDGDLGLGGFGTGDEPCPWQASDDAHDLLDQLRPAPSAEPLPVAARVVARLVGRERVSAIVGLAAPPTAGDTAPATGDDVGALVALASGARVGDPTAPATIAVVGDLSASIGDRSPRPGLESDLHPLVSEGCVDRLALARHIEAEGTTLTAALQVPAHPKAPELGGSVHVVRGVAALVASSKRGNQRPNLVQ